MPFIRLLQAILITGLLLTQPTQAASETGKEKQLKALLTRIDKLKQTIDVKEDSKSRYIKQLKTIEGDIGKVSKKAIGRTNPLTNPSRIDEKTNVPAHDICTPGKIAEAIYSPTIAISVRRIIPFMSPIMRCSQCR